MAAGTDRFRMSRHMREWQQDSLPVRPLANVAVHRAYTRALNAWTGCDWHTEFGAARLDLNGVRAAHAALLAQATAGPEAADWRAARIWLEEVEQDAATARSEAGAAVASADAGQLADALGHARRACALESKYQVPRFWPPLCDALEAAREDALQT
jgi:hypothetical protein